MKAVIMGRDDFSQFFFNICVLVGVGCVVCDHFVKSGTEYVLKPDFKGTIKSVIWSHQGAPDASVVKIVDWDTTNNFFWYNRQAQSSLNTENGDLTLRQLKPIDSGLYICALEVDNVVQKKTLRLLVIGEVSKPKVTCKKNDTNIELLCSLNPPIEAKFKWSGPEGEKEGERLSLLKSQYSGTEIFFCTAKNEVSKDTEEFNLESCFKEPTKNSGLGAGETAGIVIGVLLVLGIIGGALYWTVFRPQNGNRTHLPVCAGEREPETNLSKNNLDSEMTIRL